MFSRWSKYRIRVTILFVSTALNPKNQNTIIHKIGNRNSTTPYLAIP